MGVLAAKELRELLKTLRVIILPAVFLLFGMGGPALIRLLPTLLESAGAEGVDMSLPDFGPADGFGQFLELSRQMGLLAVIVVYMGIVSGERRDGMLATLFVKPVSRLAYLTTRWLVNGAYVALSFVAGGAVAYLYTLLLLGRVGFGTAATATGLYLTYVLLAFSWTTFFSAWMKSPPAAAGLSILPLFLLPIIGTLWDSLGELGPYGAVAAGTASLGMLGLPAVPVPGTAVLSAVLNLVWCVALLGGAYSFVRRAEL
ncbi:MAG: ABC transporter permease [Thermoleophilia bacterium]